MKISSKSKFKFLLLILITSSCYGFAQQKIAYVEADSIIQNMSEYQKINNWLSNPYVPLSEELKRKQVELQKDYESIVDTMNRFCSITPEHQEKMQERIIKKQKELEELTEKVKAEIIQKEEELFRPINEKFNKALTEVAKKNGFTYIFDKKDILYINVGIDANELVKAKLNIN